MSCQKSLQQIVVLALVALILTACKSQAPSATVPIPPTAVPIPPTAVPIPPTAIPIPPTAIPILPPIAVYPARPSETLVTPKRDPTQVSCDEEKYLEWGSPGIYIYKRFAEDRTTFLTVKRQSGERTPDLAWNRPPSGSISGIVVGSEERTTRLGTLQAVRVDTAQNYSIVSPRKDTFKGTYKTNEWYACGYGLVQLMSEDVGSRTPGLPSEYRWRSQAELVSYTPFSTNESHVRYILADMQLGNLAGDYRADVADEETAEALRRWDAGIRIKDKEIRKLERKIVNGRWQIVDAGTENPVDGMSVILDSDSQQ